jgi:hypothetical protein
MEYKQCLRRHQTKAGASASNDSNLESNPPVNEHVVFYFDLSVTYPIFHIEDVFQPEIGVVGRHDTC